MSKSLNKWSAIVGIIVGVIGIAFGAWSLHYSKRQDDNLEQSKLRKEYEDIVLLIEQGKTCKKQLVEKAAKGESITIQEKYECFKIDSLSCVSLEYFIDKHESIETLSAIDYYIAYYENKKTDNDNYRNLYEIEVVKLKERRTEVLKKISQKQLLN